MILCLACASLYPDSEANPLICPRCGHPVDRERYERIANYARDAARYGYSYRERYEAQGTSVKYAHKPDYVLSFLAIAVLSGITYDLLKLAIHRIVRSCRAKGLSIREDIEDPEWLDVFIAHVRSFREGMPNATNEIQQECRKEMYVDAYSRAVASLLSDALLHGAEPPTQDQIKAALGAAHEEVASRKAPQADDFEGCWVKIRMAKHSGESPAA